MITQISHLFRLSSQINTICVNNRYLFLQNNRRILVGLVKKHKQIDRNVGPSTSQAAAKSVSFWHTVGLSQKWRNVFNFPLIDWKSWSLRMKVKMRLGTGNTGFDEVEFAKGAAASLEFVSNCILKGDTKPLVGEGVVTEKGLRDILHHMAEGLDNQCNASAYNIQESDVVRVQFYDFESFYSKPNRGTVCFVGVLMTYIQDFDQKLEELLTSMPRKVEPQNAIDAEVMKVLNQRLVEIKLNDEIQRSLEVERQRQPGAKVHQHLRENVMNVWMEEQGAVYYVFVRAYTGRYKLKTPCCDWHIDAVKYIHKK